MKHKKLSLFIFILLASSLAACGGTSAEPVATMPVVTNTVAAAPPTEVPPTEIPPTEAPPTEIPPTEVPPTEAPPTETPIPELEPGDPQRGQDIFINGGSYEHYTPETACISCHSLDGRVSAGYRSRAIAAGRGNARRGTCARACRRRIPARVDHEPTGIHRPNLQQQNEQYGR